MKTFWVCDLFMFYRQRFYMQSSKLGMWKRYLLYIECKQKGTFSVKNGI